jgi:hypothetical protein
MDARTCLSFDVACVEFEERFAQERDATQEIPLSESDVRARDRSRQTKTVPLHSHARLMHFLGLADGDDRVTDTLDPDLMVSAAAWFQLQGLED